MLQKKKKLKKITLHKTGIWLSFLCTIHCLAMPFALTAMPFLGETLIDETAEHYLVVGSLVLAIYLLFRDFRHHRNNTPLLFVSVSGLSSLLGIFFVSHHFETPFVVTGAILMAIAYYLNWKTQPVCKH